MNTIDIIIEQIKKNFPSYAAFEVAADLKPKTVDSWKRGNSKGYLKILPKLSELFDVSTDYLLGNEQNKKSNTIGYEFGPKEKAVLERLNKIKALSEEDYELAIAQLDLIIKHREDKNNK